MNKNILLIGNFLSHTKKVPRQICEDLAGHLSEIGWNVCCASERMNIVCRLGDMLSTVWRRRRWLSVAQVDVFARKAFVFAEATCFLLRRAGKPYVLTLHSGSFPEFASRHPHRVARLLRSAAAVTAPSHYLTEQMRGYRDDIVLLPNPLDLSRYRFVCREAPEPNIMWLRAFHRVYNPSLAVRALASLTQEFPRIRLTMVGPDKGDGSLQETRRLAEELGVSDRVTFVGAVNKEEVPRWICGGDIFLNTTNEDNTPVSVMEAMASGLCVVSTNVGGIPDLCRDEHDSLLVPGNDATAMATAVRRFIVEPGLARRLSRNGRVNVERFDWSTVLPRWDLLLSAVAEECPA